MTGNVYVKRIGDGLYICPIKVWFITQETAWLGLVAKWCLHPIFKLIFKFFWGDVTPVRVSFLTQPTDIIWGKTISRKALLLWHQRKGTKSELNFLGTSQKLAKSPFTNHSPGGLPPKKNHDITITINSQFFPGKSPFLMVNQLSQGVLVPANSCHNYLKNNISPGHRVFFFSMRDVRLANEHWRGAAAQLGMLSSRNLI